MYLVTHVLDATDTTAKQKILCPRENVQLHAVRPHILRYGNPLGNVRMRLLDTNLKSIEVSPSVEINMIGSLAYWHGYVRFYLTSMLKGNTNYYFQMETTGYTYSSTDWIGWVNDYDLRKFALGYTPTSDLYAPLDLEIWEDVQYNRKYA